MYVRICIHLSLYLSLYIWYTILTYHIIILQVREVHAAPAVVVHAVAAPWGWHYLSNATDLLWAVWGDSRETTRAWGPAAIDVSRQSSTRVHGHRGLRNGRRPILGGTTCLNATCLIRPRLFHAPFAVSKIARLRQTYSPLSKNSSVRQVVLDKW